jgi:hypothetical protein
MEGKEMFLGDLFIGKLGMRFLVVLHSMGDIRLLDPGRREGFAG